MSVADPSVEAILARVRDVPDFPRPGVGFKDITPLLADPELFGAVVRDLSRVPDGGSPVDVVVGIEARGFVLAAPVALGLGVAFAPARKKGKLPYRTVSREYSLEYGTATVELHVDAVAPGQRVLVVDDVLATGGTAVAVCELVEELGGTVAGVAVLMELSFLNGRPRLGERPVRALVTL